MLAPLLALLGGLAMFRAPSVRMTQVSIYAALVVILLLVKHISFFGTGSLYSSLLWDDLVKLGYFMVPILCIRSMDQFQKVGWVVCLIAVAGCLSAFLVSVGLLTLPLARFEASRLGVDELRKAIGLFPSYGDLAQYLSFAVLWVILAPGVKNKRNKLLRRMRYLVAIAVVLGLLSTQSRNVLLSLIVAISVLWVLVRAERAGARSKEAIMLGLVAGGVVLIGVLGVFAADIIGGLSGLGGEYARNTAEARLKQYAIAWEIISASPLFGADLDVYQKFGPYIEGIHNVWLRLAAHGGLLSVLVLLLLLGRIYYDTRKAARISVKAEHAKIVIGYLAALLVAVEFYVGMGEMFWALLGIAASLSCIEPFRSPSADRVATAKDKREDAVSARILAPRKRARA